MPTNWDHSTDDRVFIDAPLDRKKRALWLKKQLARIGPLKFREKWRCERIICDGQPHEGRDFKHARTKQVIDGPDENGTLPGRISYLVGGRGSGKTWGAGRNFAQLVLDTEPDDGDDRTEWAVIAPIYRSARDVMIEGPSGLIRAFGGYERRGGLVKKWDRTYGHLELTNGAFVYVDSADDGAVRVQGLNLYGAWCGEIGLWKSWKRAWRESIAFAVRKGPARIICDGTPKMSSLAKELLDDPTVWRRRLRTLDNLANLAKSAVDDLRRRYEGTTLGIQELEGILVDEVEGALWKRAKLNENRVEPHMVEDPTEGFAAGTLTWQRSDGSLMAPPRLWHRIAVGLDPSDGTEDSDEQGIGVIGHSQDDHELYLLWSDGLRLAPFAFLSHAVDLTLYFAGRQAEIPDSELWSGIVSSLPLIVFPTSAYITVEKNHGGLYLVDLLEQVFKAKGVRVPYQVVTASASQGKRTRAEAVAGMDERGRMHHVGVFAELEDQQATWTGVGKDPSPDRMDAYVWAAKEFTDLALQSPGPVNEVVPWEDPAGLVEAFMESMKDPDPFAEDERTLPAIKW